MKLSSSRESMNFRDVHIVQNVENPNLGTDQKTFRSTLGRDQSRLDEISIL